MATKAAFDGHPDGIYIGNAVTDKLGFYGKTAVTRRSCPASIGATATTAILKAAINKLMNLIKTAGLGA